MEAKRQALEAQLTYEGQAAERAHTRQLSEQMDQAEANCQRLRAEAFEHLERLLPQAVEQWFEFMRCKRELGADRATMKLEALPGAYGLLDEILGRLTTQAAQPTREEKRAHNKLLSQREAAAQARRVIKMKHHPDMKTAPAPIQFSKGSKIREVPPEQLEYLRSQGLAVGIVLGTENGKRLGLGFQSGPPEQALGAGPPETSTPSATESGAHNQCADPEAA